MDGIRIIAEAGVNHNGSLETAKALVSAAKECGADIVKFQTMNVDGLVSKYAAMADYQKNNLGFEKPQNWLLKKRIFIFWLITAGRQEFSFYLRHLILIVFIFWTLCRICGKYRLVRLPIILILLR